MQAVLLPERFGQHRGAMPQQRVAERLGPMNSALSLPSGGRRLGLRGTKERETDILLRRAEKLRRDASNIRRNATRLSHRIDRQCIKDVANNLEADARALEQRGRRRGYNTKETQHVSRQRTPPEALKGRFTRY